MALECEVQQILVDWEVDSHNAEEARGGRINEH